MLNTEDGCIRYLMKEMDPSEEIEFEREMMNDQNLLIEVESLRRTYQKLGRLPLKNPPEEIRNEISLLAVSVLQERRENSKRGMHSLIRYVAAAAVALMVFSSGFYFYGDALNTQVLPEEQNITTPVENLVKPWVDRNNVLRFAGTSAQEDNNADVQSDVDQSFSRLKLVNEQAGFNQSARKIILTNSSN